MKIFKFCAEVLVPKFTRGEVSLADSEKAVHQVSWLCTPYKIFSSIDLQQVNAFSLCDISH